MSRANDCPIPVAHHDIVTIFQTVRARSIADAFLAFLELLKKAEISGNWTDKQSQGIRTLS
jgi:hypothetical protein